MSQRHSRLQTKQSTFISKFLPSGRNSHCAVNLSASMHESCKRSYQDLKQVVTPKGKFVKCVYAVIAVIRLRNILEQVKIFGTTSNIFNLNFRNRNNVYRSLKPPKQVDQKLDNK